MNYHKPLDIQLNAAIVAVANRLCPTGYDISPDAPDTYEDLVAHVKRTGRICVFDGASDKTIYADKEVNYAFRAWHDWVHVQCGFDFTLNGEAMAVEVQISHLYTLFGRSVTTEQWAEYMRAEVIGQALYEEVHGEFPDDQRAFVLSYITTPIMSLFRKF